MSKPPVEEPNAALFSPGDLFVLVVRHPLCVLVAMVASLGLALTQIADEEPVFHARSTLLLRGRPTTEGALDQLRTLEEESNASSELALLTSTRVAQLAVDDPADGRLMTEGASLGLATQVDDEQNAPLAGLRNRILGQTPRDGRLFARARAGVGAPRDVRISFSEEGNVRVARRVSWNSDADAATYAFTPGAKISYHGLELWLEPQGDVRDKSFRVRVHIEREIVRSVRDRCDAKETENGSGVIELTFEDADPHRAAAVANALVTNYLELGRARVTERAAAALERVEAELARIQEELTRTHAELTRMQSAQPLSIRPEESAKFLTLNIADLEVEHARASLELSLVTDAIEGLEGGHLGALSRLLEASTDKTTRILIEHISQLEAQAELQERADTGKYRHLIQVQLLQLEGDRTQVAFELAELRGALAAMQAEGQSGLGLLGGNGLEAAGLDPVTNVLLDKVARLQAEQDELLAGDYLPDHPQVRQLEGAIHEHLARVEDVLSQRVTALQSKLDRHDRIRADTEGLLTALPASERREIENAIERLAGVVLEHLRSLNVTAEARAASLETEIGEMRAELAALPASERMQLGPLQRVENYKQRVGDLLAAREAAKLAAAFAEPPAKLIDPASPPARRSAPRLTFHLGMGALVGLGIGLLLAFLAERWKRELRTPVDLARASEHPVLGVVPRMRAVEKRGGLRELFDLLKRDPLGENVAPYYDLWRSAGIVRGPRGRGVVLGVTSCLPGEGKTSTALGVAVSLAASRRRVLLVNAGMKRSDRDAGGRRGRSGVSQCLAGVYDWKQVIGQSGLDGFDLVSAGTPAPMAVDQFNDPQALRLLDEWREAYDVIVFDLPSLRLGPEVEVFAPELDQLWLVCQSGVPKPDDVTSVCRRLVAAGVRIGGVVLNRVHGRRLGRMSETALARLGLIEDHWDPGKAA